MSLLICCPFDLGLKPCTLRGFVGRQGPRAKAARSKASPAGPPRSGAELHKPRLFTGARKRAALKALRARAKPLTFKAVSAGWHPRKD